MCLNESDQLKIKLSVNADGANSVATVGPRIRLTFNLNYDVIHWVQSAEGGAKRRLFMVHHHRCQFGRRLLLEI